MQLYLVRHAQSENNSKPESERVEDPGITSLGHQQADALSKWMASVDIDFLVTSGFLRALQTADYVSRSTRLPINVWRDIHEVGGCYRGYIKGKEEGAPGMSHQAIHEAYPESIIDPAIGPEGWWGSRPYESQADATHRARKMLDQITRQFAETEKSVVAIIHADFKVCLLRLLLGDSFVEELVGPMMNAGVTKFTYTHSTWQLQMLNSVTHLNRNQWS